MGEWREDLMFNNIRFCTHIFTRYPHANGTWLSAHRFAAAGQSPVSLSPRTAADSADYLEDRVPIPTTIDMSFG